MLRFLWRATHIAQKKAQNIDDRYGPLALCGAVVAALVAIFIITLVDFWCVRWGLCDVFGTINESCAVVLHHRIFAFG